MIVFDLDGTLANFDHRKHIIAGKSRDDTLAWALFYQACIDDKPIYPIINVLMATFLDTHVEIWTGRSEVCREQTIEWLTRHVFKDTTLFDFNFQLRMRNKGDRRHDWELKEQWLKACSVHVSLVFEDRDSVVAMFRKNNVMCAQVAQGAY